MKTEKMIRQLERIEAPQSLKERVHGMVGDLPAKHRGIFFPLIAFQAAVVVGVLLLLVGLGSGVVVAAKGSHPGSPLYSVRQIIEKVPVVLQKPSLPPTRVIPQATTTPAFSPKRERHAEEKDPEREVQNRKEEKDVEGIHTGEGKKKEKDMLRELLHQESLEK